MTAADFLVTHRDTDLAQAAQDQGAQAHSFVGAHDIDLLANVRRHQDVQLHFAQGLGRSDSSSRWLGSGGRLRTDRCRRCLLQKRGELLARHAGTFPSTFRTFKSSNFANSLAMAATSRAAAPSGSMTI